MSGSSSRFLGDLMALSGQVNLSGSSGQINGSVFGWTVSISGSNWTIENNSGACRDR